MNQQVRCREKKVADLSTDDDGSEWVGDLEWQKKAGLKRFGGVKGACWQE